LHPTVTAGRSPLARVRHFTGYAARKKGLSPSPGRTLLRSLLIAVAAVVVLAPSSAALADPTPAEVQKQIDEGNKALELVVESYNKINEELATTQASLAELDKTMRPLLTKVEEATANVGEIANTVYKTGSNMRSISLMLSAKSSSSLIDRYGALQLLTIHQQHEIEAFADVKRQYDTEKKRLDDLLATQNGQKVDLAAKKTKIESDIARLDAMQKKVAGGKTTPASYGSPPSVSGTAGKVVDFAWAQLNEKYVFGAAGPDQWDCSGLTMMAWKAGGKSLPHNAEEQYNTVHHISRSQLAPGDLVFYNDLGHVAIYIGNDQIIHAPNSRTVVKVGPINGDPIVGYGRP
jgi:cell wall-associated NlpC family hydrolase